MIYKVILPLFLEVGQKNQCHIYEILKDIISVFGCYDICTWNYPGLLNKATFITLVLDHQTWPRHNRNKQCHQITMFHNTYKVFCLHNNSTCLNVMLIVLKSIVSKFHIYWITYAQCSFETEVTNTKAHFSLFIVMHKWFVIYRSGNFYPR